MRAANHIEHRKRQESILEQTLAVLRASPHVLGVVATGSYARGEQDAFSDLDIGCYLRDESRIGCPNLYAEVGAVATTLAMLYLYDLHALYLFADGVRLDLDFKPPSAIPTDEAATARILYDPEGRLAQDMGRQHLPARQPHPAHFEPGDPSFIDWFFWMFRQAFCWTQRAAQGDYRRFTKLAMVVDSLAEVRTNLIQMRMWTLVDQQSYYLDEVDPDLGARLVPTYPRLVPEDLRAATRRLLEVFESVAPDYCRKTGIAYPAEKCVILRQLLDEFENEGHRNQIAQSNDRSI